MGVAALGWTAFAVSGQNAITLTEQSPVITQDFDGMWDATEQQALLTLPDGCVLTAILTHLGK